MAQVTLIAPRVIPAGTFGPSAAHHINAAAGDRILTIQFLSNDWASGESGLICDWTVDKSFDSGQTWSLYVGGQFLGGAVNARTGQLPAVFVFLPANTAVDIRATLTLNQQANSLGFARDVTAA